MMPIYARDGSPEFNRWLHEILLRIADDVERVLGKDLIALILGGGYGRGEGGVVHTDDKEMPYNDLDFTLVTERKSGLPLDRLNAMCAPYAKELGIHVDFSRPLTIEDVERWPHWLMWRDLLNGHVVLKGPEDVLLRHAPQSLNEPLPAIEGTRLLLNRGAGLLWAMRVVHGVEAAPDEDFVRRNYYKCALALGDALLICFQRYTTKYLGRDAIFEALEKAEPRVAALGLLPGYKEALRFKFRPDLFTATPLTCNDLLTAALMWGSVFLLVETERTGRPWKCLEEYTAWRGVRERDEHTLRGLGRNIVRNAQLGVLSWRYPREALYRQAPVLLGVAGNINDWASKSETKQSNGSISVVVAPENMNRWAAETQQFLHVWDRFN